MIRYPCDCAPEEVRHEYVSEAANGEFIDYTIKCTGCGHLEVIPQELWSEACRNEVLKEPKRRVNLTSYPRIEPHTGEVVNSRDDEVRAMKAHGMHAAPHGVNEAFDDETCHNLKTKRLAIEQKKREITRRREAAGRPAHLRRVK